MLLKDEFLYKWAEVSGFDFRKLLEDNQNLSLPMITLVDNTPVIFAFVYSCIPNNKVVVSQRHFWDMETHRMVLCKTIYKHEGPKHKQIDEKSYLQALYNVANLLFARSLSNTEKQQCKEYLRFLEDNHLRKLFFSENKMLAMWAESQSLL